MKLIIFDVDGTLLNSNAVDSTAFAETFEKLFGFPIRGIDWHQYPHVTDTSILDEVFKENLDRSPTKKEVELMKEAFVDRLKFLRSESPDKFFQIPGVQSLMETLKHRSDFAIGIGTGGWKAPAMVKLKHLNIHEGYTAMAFADGHYSRNAIVQDALDQAHQNGQSYEKIVYVGDGTWDHATCQAMGIPFIGLRHRGDFDVLSNLGTKHILRNFEDQERFFEYVDKV